MVLVVRTFLKTGEGGSIAWQPWLLVPPLRPKDCEVLAAGGSPQYSPLNQPSPSQGQTGAGISQPHLSGAGPG